MSAAGPKFQLDHQIAPESAPALRDELPHPANRVRRIFFNLPSVRRRGRLAPASGDLQTPIRKQASADVSITGIIYVAMLLFMGVAAVNSQANLLFGVFGLMVGVLLISSVISRLVMSRIGVRRVLPEHASVGLPTTIVYEFENRKRFWPSLSLRLSEVDGAEAFVRQPQAYMLHAAAKMTASVPVEVTPRRRGLHTLDEFQISTSFPFGFIKRAIGRREKDTLLVFPAIGRVRNGC